jgi:hypothetical protein
MKGWYPHQVNKASYPGQKAFSNKNIYKALERSLYS